MSIIKPPLSVPIYPVVGTWHQKHSILQEFTFGYFNYSKISFYVYSIELHDSRVHATNFYPGRDSSRGLITLKIISLATVILPLIGLVYLAIAYRNRSKLVFGLPVREIDYPNVIIDQIRDILNVNVNVLLDGEDYRGDPAPPPNYDSLNHPNWPHRQPLIGRSVDLLSEDRQRIGNSLILDPFEHWKNLADRKGIRRELIECYPKHQQGAELVDRIFRKDPSYTLAKLEEDFIENRLEAIAFELRECVTARNLTAQNLVPVEEAAAPEELRRPYIYWGDVTEQDKELLSAMLSCEHPLANDWRMFAYNLRFNPRDFARYPPIERGRRLLDAAFCSLENVDGLFQALMDISRCDIAGTLYLMMKSSGADPENVLIPIPVVVRSIEELHLENLPEEVEGSNFLLSTEPLIGRWQDLHPENQERFGVALSRAGRSCEFLAEKMAIPWALMECHPRLRRGKELLDRIFRQDRTYTLSDLENFLKHQAEQNFESFHLTALAQRLRQLTTSQEITQETLLQDEEPLVDSALPRVPYVYWADVSEKDKELLGAMLSYEGFLGDDWRVLAEKFGYRLCEFELYPCHLQGRMVLDKALANRSLADLITILKITSRSDVVHLLSRMIERSMG